MQVKRLDRLTACLVIFFLIIFSSEYLKAEADNVTLERPLDGETVQLSDGRRVQLIGVTTKVRAILAERYQLSEEQINKLPLQNMMRESMAYIQSRVVGRNIILSFDPSNEKMKHMDKEGRILAYIWYTTHSSSMDNEGASMGIVSLDRLLNQELIINGLALTDISHPFVQQNLFLEYEKDAAKAKKGFWRSAAELYQDLLDKARKTSFGSTADFLNQEVKQMSLQSSYEAYEKMIQINPKDYRPYYERSWLGVNPTHNKVGDQNLQDIERAIELSPFNPKCYMQKSFLLRLTKRYDEASEAYEKAVNLASKLGMPAPGNQFVEAEAEKEKWKDYAGDPVKKRALFDVLRATLNEDHFLFYYARLLSYGVLVPEDFRTLQELILNMGRFQIFLKKNQDKASMDFQKILYQTQWAVRGFQNPENVLAWLETVGEAPSLSAPENNVISIKLETPEAPKKKKQDPSKATVSDTAFT